MPFFLCSIALVARSAPFLNAKPPGTPRFTMIRVRSPAKVCSAFSSNVVRSSKYFSTLAALLVPNPMSSKAAPNVNAPFGMSIRPAPTPANMDSSVPTLLTRSSKFKPPLLPVRPPIDMSTRSFLLTLPPSFIPVFAPGVVPTLP